jgi:predicted ribosome quality control (RQC) complex YloA/Tae2 family protein
LTEEEKREKLAELRQKMAEKRERKTIEDAKEQKASETLRRKAGKVCLIRFISAALSTVSRTWGPSKKKWKNDRL